MNSSIPPFDTSSTGRKPRSVRSVLLAATVVSILLNFVPMAEYLLYPLRLFVTLIHEGGHALATVLTGGSVQALRINPDTSGVTMSLGGIFAFVSMAGYVGTTAFGALCLQLARGHTGGKQGLVLLAATAAIITALWVNPFGAGIFTFLCGAVITVALFAAARKLPEQSAAILLSFLAVQLCLNALFDLRTLLLLTTQTTAPNDAVFMAREYGLTPWFWALLWTGISGVILAASLRSWWRATK